MSGKGDGMRFVIVTGLSGAGKSSALKILEDGGYFCVDNLPVRLIGKFAQILTDGSDPSITQIAVGIDIRSGRHLDRIEEAIRLVEETGILCEVLYLEASDDVLLKRYKETRRTHPLAGPGGRIEEGIVSERQALAYLRSRASYLIDTSQLLVRDLKKEMDKIFVRGEIYHNLYITIMSFGFKYGIPADADLVFDVRFLPNPYYIDDLRPLTGEDQPVRDYLLQYEETDIFLNKLEDMIRFLIPHYIEEGKNQLVIAIGCTGGCHRSVMLAGALYERMETVPGCGCRLDHRDMVRDPIRKKGDH